MAAPDYFIKSLIRIASLQGRDAIEAIITGNYTATIIANGGKQMTGASANGKSFSYSIPSSLTTEQLMAKAEEALTWFDAFTAEGVDISAWLSARPVSHTVGRFRNESPYWLQRTQ